MDDEQALDHAVTPSPTGDDASPGRAMRVAAALQAKGGDEFAKPGKLVSVGPDLVKGKPRLLNLYMSCYHCERPWCVPACPTGAMTRREEDGVVYVREELCVGCKACITACPWAAPQWNAQTGKVDKCDLCRDRIDQGLKPACVTTCAMSCLQFSTPDAASQDKRQEFAEHIQRSRPAGL